MKIEGLNAFIHKPIYSTEREKMMEHWLCSKIYEACFARHIRPLIYTTEYDRGGFDLAVGIGSEFCEFQLKVVAKKARTRKWKIDYTLLWPRIDMLEDFCILAEGNAFAGRMGGVILMEVDANAEQIKDVRLFYCDIGVLAFRNLRQGPSDAPASQLYRLLQTPLKVHKEAEKGKKIVIPKSCFLEMPSVASLLTLAGLPLDEFGSFPHEVRTSVRPILCRRVYEDREAGEHWWPLSHLEHRLNRILQIKH